MLKNLINLNGVEKLNRKQQLSINGGRKECINWSTGECDEYGLQCAELICQLLPF